jgi:hypothetical protein
LSFLGRGNTEVLSVRHRVIDAYKASQTEVVAPTLEESSLPRALDRWTTWWLNTPIDRYLRPALLTIYAVAMGVAAWHHEPWVDEAQAWLLARDANPIRLVTKLLAYEGHPGLWYLVLMLPARLLPYRALNLISGVAAGWAAYLVVRRSPFPIIVKVLLPFTFFLFFQYGVVARNYALLPGTLFLVAIAYRDSLTRPYKFAGLLFLLANVSVHGFLMAAAIAGITFMRVVSGRFPLTGDLRKANLLALAALGMGMAIVALIMRPPADRDFARPRTGTLIGRVLRAAVDMSTNGWAGSRLLLVLILMASLVFFWRARVLWLWLLPAAAIIVFSELVYGSPWHEGILFLGWIFALWVGLERFERRDPVDAWIRPAILTALLVVCAIQVSWTVASVRADFVGPYSGSKALAEYIKERSLERRVIYGIAFPSMAVLPYFEGNIYDNYHAGEKPSYWDWSSRNDMIIDPAEIERQRPDYIVVPLKAAGAEDLLKQFPSYRQESVFQGALLWKTGGLEPDVYVLLRRADLLPRK